MDDKFTRLSIKADRSGIAVYVPAHMSTDDICSELYSRFSHNICALEKKGTVAVTFRGDSPTETESCRIVDFLNSMDMNNVSFRYERETKEGTKEKKIELCKKIVTEPIYDNSDMIHKGFQRYYDKSCENNSGINANKKNIPYIFIGDIGRKQTLEIKGNVIIIGNVARDAKVISGKSIIIIGALYGTAIAGRCNGAGVVRGNMHNSNSTGSTGSTNRNRIYTNDSFVLAMHMSPKFLQIGTVGSETPYIENYADSSVLATNDGTTISITYI